MKYIFCLGLTLLAAAFWGTSGPATRIAMGYGVTPLTIAFVRAAGAALILGLYGMFSKRRLVLFQAKELSRHLMDGLFGVAGMFFFNSLGMLLIPVGMATVLFYTAPFWVIIIAHLMRKEQINLLRLLCLILGFGGVLLTVSETKIAGYADLAGIFFMLLAGLCFAIYIINGKYGSGDKDPFGNYFNNFFWGALILLVVSLPLGNLYQLQGLPFKAWLLLIYWVLFPTVGGYGLILFSLRFLPGGVVSITSMAEIPFAILWGWMFLKESPDLGTQLGASLIICAICLLSLENEGFRNKVRQTLTFKTQTK